MQACVGVGVAARCASCLIIVGVSCVFLSDNFSLQVFVEMPFDIKNIECPTHKIKMKVIFVSEGDLLTNSVTKFVILHFFLVENGQYGNNRTLSWLSFGHRVSASRQSV